MSRTSKTDGNTDVNSIDTVSAAFVGAKQRVRTTRNKVQILQSECKYVLGEKQCGIF